MATHTKRNPAGFDLCTFDSPSNYTRTRNGSRGSGDGRRGQRAGVNRSDH